MTRLPTRRIVGNRDRLTISAEVIAALLAAWSMRGRLNWYINR
jgi:hypothetical protein